MQIQEVKKANAETKKGLACGAGILSRYLPHNAFQTISSDIDFAVNRKKNVTLREAVSILSLDGG